MITLFVNLVVGPIVWMIRFIFQLILIPFRIVFFPLRVLFGIPPKKRRGKVRIFERD